MDNDQKTELMNMFVDWMSDNLEPHMADDQAFVELMQGILFTTYMQLKNNIGAHHALLALGNVMQVAAEMAPGCGVNVDLIHTPPHPKTAQ